MMSSFRFDMAVFSVVLIVSIVFGVFLGLYERNERLSHTYVVSTSSNFDKVQYYIDDYTIEDGAIVFYIDGVKYHLTDYCVKKIEK